MLKSYKYRIYPNKKQSGFIDRQISACRFIYNLALETKINAYKAAKINLTAYDLINQFTEVRQATDWIKELERDAQDQAIIDMDKAYKSFFKGNGFPKFRSKKRNQSFRTRNSIRVDFVKNTITIPKLKNIPIVFSRTFDGNIKHVTVSKTKTGKYFASVLVENNAFIPCKPKQEPDNTIGLDLGLKDFMVTSEGIRVENPRFLKNTISRISVLQRRKRNKKKGSNNWRKSNLQIAKLHERVKNQRTDYLQKLSTKLVCDSQATTFCFESLAIKNMVKNHKLSQSISDVSWHEFLRMVQYKCDWYGKNFVQIDRFEPSSKTCSECGEINNDLQLSDREWSCKSCGIVHDRDINAAINIKNAGLRKSEESVEQLPIGNAKKQKSRVS